MRKCLDELVFEAISQGFLGFTLFSFTCSLCRVLFVADAAAEVFIFVITVEPRNRLGTSLRVSGPRKKISNVV